MRTRAFGSAPDGGATHRLVGGNLAGTVYLTSAVFEDKSRSAGCVRARRVQQIAMSFSRSELDLLFRNNVISAPAYELLRQEIDT
jgi:hypothetical protein